MTTENSFMNNVEIWQLWNVCLARFFSPWLDWASSSHQLWAGSSGKFLTIDCRHSRITKLFFPVRLIQDLLRTGLSPRRPLEIKLLSFHCALFWESIYKIEPRCTWWPPSLRKGRLGGGGVETMFTEFSCSSVFNNGRNITLSTWVSAFQFCTLTPSWSQKGMWSLAQGPQSHWALCPCWHSCFFFSFKWIFFNRTCYF